MAEVEYSVGLPPANPVAELLQVAEEVERLGYRYLWVNDERLERDPFTVLPAIAQRTERIRLGPGVTNPYSRHPALIATAMATLDELSGGRTVLGLGAGGTNHRALGRVAAGAARAARDVGEIRLTAWLYACVADDAEEALDAIRPMAATSLVTSRPVLGELGIEMPEGFRARMEARGWSLDWEAVAEAGATLPAELVQRFGIAGTPDFCRNRLSRLLEAVPQISQVAIVPFAPTGGTVLETLRCFIDEVALEPVAWS